MAGLAALRLARRAAARRAARLALRQRLAGRRRVVAVHQPAPLRRPAGLAGGAGGGAAVLALSLYLALALALFARWRRGRVAHRRGAVRRAVAAGRAGAHGASSPAFPGWPAAMRRSTARWPPGRRGSASAASARSARCWPRCWRRLAPARSAASCAGGAGGWRWLVPALSALVGTREFSQPSGELSVSLLQGNVPQDEKFSMQHVPQTLAWVAHALRRGARRAGGGAGDGRAAAAGAAGRAGARLLAGAARALRELAARRR